MPGLTGEMDTRDELQREIQDTQLAFHRLLDDVPDTALGVPSDNPRGRSAKSSST
jgi:hypothetical protein